MRCHLAQATTDRFPVDVFHLTADGRTLLQLPTWDQRCGDTTCRMTSGTASVIDVTGPGPTQSVGAALTPVTYSDTIDLVERPGSNSRLAVGGLSLVMNDPEITIRSHPGLTALAMMPAHDDLLAFRREDSALVLIPFDPGIHEVVSASSTWSYLFSPPIDRKRPVISSDGNVVAFPKESTRCIEAAEDPTQCVAQVWEMVVWSRQGGTVRIHHSTEQLRASWVGADGTLLVAGELIQGEAPQAGPAGYRGDSALYLLAPSGEVLARWPSTVEQLLEIEGGLLVVVRDTSGNAQLQRIEVATGAVHTIADGALENRGPSAIRFWTDDAKSRLIYLEMWPSPDGAPPLNALYAGAMP